MHKFILFLILPLFISCGESVKLSQEKKFCLITLSPYDSLSVNDAQVQATVDIVKQRMLIYNAYRQNFEVKSLRKKIIIKYWKEEISGKFISEKLSKILNAKGKLELCLLAPPIEAKEQLEMMEKMFNVTITGRLHFNFSYEDPMAYYHLGHLASAEISDTASINDAMNKALANELTDIKFAWGNEAGDPEFYLYALKKPTVIPKVISERIEVENAAHGYDVVFTLDDHSVAEIKFHVNELSDFKMPICLDNKVVSVPLCMAEFGNKLRLNVGEKPTAYFYASMLGSTEYPVPYYVETVEFPGKPLGY